MSNNTLIDETRFYELKSVLDSIIPEFKPLKLYNIPDVKEIVTNCLKSHGLKFEFDDKTGNFIIPIVAGVGIIGELGQDEDWLYTLGVGLINKNYDDIEYTQNQRPIFSPEAIERYIPIFKAIISKTENFLRPVLAAKKKAESFKDFLNTEIAKLGLIGVTVEPVEALDYKKGVNYFVKDTCTITKEIISGLRIGYQVTPENYQSKCNLLKELIDRIPETFREDDWSNIHCMFENEVEKDRFKTGGGSWADSPERMNYVDIPVTEVILPEKLPISEKVVKKLTEMGFMFSFDENKLNVQLSNDFALCRDAKKTYFKTSMSESKKLSLSDEDFITIMRIIAKASTRNGYLIPKELCLAHSNIYPSSFFDGMFPAIREFVPPKSYYSTNSKNDCIVTISPIMGFLLPNKSAANTLWTFLGNIDAIIAVRKMQSKKTKGSFVEVEWYGSWMSLRKYI